MSNLGCFESSDCASLRVHGVVKLCMNRWILLVPVNVHREPLKVPETYISLMEPMVSIVVPPFG